VGVLQLRHVLEVHAVHTGHDGDGHEDDGPGGESLDRLVQTIRGNRGLHLDEPGHEVANGVDLLREPQEVIVDVLEVGNVLRTEEREVTSQQRVDDLTFRGDHPPHEDQLVPQVDDGQDVAGV